VENEAQRIAFHRAEIDLDRKIAQAERDSWVLGSIEYHSEFLIHPGAAEATEAGAAAH
jgi:hypothetical protein